MCAASIVCVGLRSIVVAVTPVREDLTVPCEHGTAKVFLNNNNNRVRVRSIDADSSPRLCFFYTTLSQY
jgi:hypothetical protein